ncbi:MAG: GGDEF domain-containing protein [Lachnospiraceae bacterium]|nr:GGDEF domain-containing protein [Lachnospiraceae bacterium]
MKMTVELFDSIINTSQDCVFWKDIDRRFLGVNQAFLDFYGFESANILIGKTDEDMGWHTDPEPYRQDELNVLSGHSTYKVPGKCIIRGEERDIIASKRPLYDGDRIVGLVGSFVDVTDVLKRQTKYEGLHNLYTVETLRKYPFFDKLLDETGLDEILDPLTGVLSRGYALSFVHSLISSGTPFTFAILDLDNFKFINDSHGHSVGDLTLKAVTASLASFTDGYGLIGRFGGDEILIINLKDLDYQDKQKYFTSLYSDHNILRHNIPIEDGFVYITGTIGCATFPNDADNYNDLFALIDKTLYLGKSKGRNCYVIYVEDKHKELEIKKLVKHNIYTDMYNMKKIFNKGASLRERLSLIFPFLSDSLQITDLYVIDNDNNLKAVLDESVCSEVEDISVILNKDIFCESSLESVKSNTPLLYNALSNLNISSCLIVRIGNDVITNGYLLCGVHRDMRIWQENECALLFFLSDLISSTLQSHFLQLL